MERECAAGLHWEQSLSKCVPAQQSTCRVPGNTEVIEEEIVVEEVVNMDDFCKGVVFDILPYPESRRRYIVCISGKGTERFCRRGMRFNKNLRACVPGGNQIRQ
jgi:Chitin binding Peritrophin-A domain